MVQQEHVTPSSQPSRQSVPAETSYRPGYELVAERLLAYISEEGLRAGDRLPTEQGLAEVLDSTRTVTREAIKTLAAVGRLSVRKGAGIFVASSVDLLGDRMAHFMPTNMEQVVMLLDYRRLIEGETTRRAAAMATPPQVRGIREAAEQSVIAAELGDVAAFAAADASFHAAVSSAANNLFLDANVASLRKLAAQSDVLLFHGDVPGSLVVAAQQHIHVADAIAGGNPEAAVAAMNDHIETTRNQFERKIRDRIFNVTR